MRHLKSACATLALTVFIQPVFIQPIMAASCVSRTDATALKIAVMRQQLIVAALKCGEADGYHLFADSFRTDLKAADNTVQAFFAPRGGMGEYEAFRGKAARLAWAEEAANNKAFCSDARDLLSAAKQRPGSLMDFAQTRSGAINGAGFCLPQTKPQAIKIAAVKAVVAVPVIPATMTTPVPTPRSIEVRRVKAVPVSSTVPMHQIAMAEVPRFEVTPEEPTRITRYYTPPLDAYDVDDVLQATPITLARDDNEPARTWQAQDHQAEQDWDDAEDDAPVYGRRDWNQQAYGPPPGWQPGYRNWSPRDDAWGWYPPRW